MVCGGSGAAMEVRQSMSVTGVLGASQASGSIRLRWLSAFDGVTKLLSLSSLFLFTLKLLRVSVWSSKSSSCCFWSLYVLIWSEISWRSKGMPELFWRTKCNDRSHTWFQISRFSASRIWLEILRMDWIFCNSVRVSWKSLGGGSCAGYLNFWRSRRIASFWASDWFGFIRCLRLCHTSFQNWKFFLYL